MPSSAAKVTSLRSENLRILGLSETVAAGRVAEYGQNRVSAVKERSFLSELVESLREPLVLLLIAVAVLYFVFGELRDALIVLGVIFAVALTESGIEWRAGRAVKALSDLAQPTCLVWRDGVLSERPVEVLVPGDVVELRPGSRIPADARLTSAHDLAVDESLLTGESEPVSRVPGDASAAELRAGTLVVRGSGIAEITKTGSSSALGQIATLVAQVEEPKTPMQVRMGELARVLLWAALAVSTIIPLIGVGSGRPFKEMLLTGLSLAFATIPEELPVLIVVVLGLGSLRLARRGAIVRRLRAAETLGAVTVICTDKTGTLTANRMTLSAAVTAGELLGGARSPNDGLLHAASLASEAQLATTILDPMDAAIRAAATGAPTAAENFVFDQSRRMSSGYAAMESEFLAGVKGAPASVLSRCISCRISDRVELLDEDKRQALLQAASALGRNGRVLAVASRSLPSKPRSRDDAETDLVFEGVVVLRDPVRPEASEALAALALAGVKVSMITGDQLTTARAVADEAGVVVRHQLLGTDLSALDDATLARQLREGTIVARAQPADKLRIVEALTASGAVVMVTGDGVNDAPALRAAAVGVAMGRAGSDAAREAADVVLTNDSFATLVDSVREGRRLFDNFRKAIRFYLAVKLALILISAIAAVLQQPLPFTPVQIVILELFMDLGAALAFVNQPADADIMVRPPRDPIAPFLGRDMIWAILAGGITLTCIVLAGFLYGLTYMDLAQARMLSLVGWFVGHAALGLVMAFGDGPPRFGVMLQNPILLLWLIVSIVFAALIVALPPLADAIGAATVAPGTAALLGVAAMIGPLWLLFRRGGESQRKARLSTKMET